MCSMNSKLDLPLQKKRKSTLYYSDLSTKARTCKTTSKGALFLLSCKHNSIVHKRIYALISEVQNNLPMMNELILVYLLCINVTSIVAYAWDKNCARTNSRRISERTLHFLSLAGGWIGALFAQRIFRHKTQKRSFRINFWISVGLNLGICALWIKWVISR